MKRIGVLTSGGDSPGMNAAINGIVENVYRKNIEVRGYLDGYSGLIENNFIELTPSIVKPQATVGGTFIGSSRAASFKDEKVQLDVVSRLKSEGVEGLVVIGGDGSYRGARAIANLGIPTIGIPGTIDNDIPVTELTLGFKTAVRNVFETVKVIMKSAASHKHIYAIEVMGRKSGDIATWSGKALDADGIIAETADFDVDNVREIISCSQKIGKKYQLFIVAEGAMTCAEFKEKIEQDTDYSVHSLMLGHIQRGGDPVAEDCILGNDYGEHAFKLLMQGASGRCTAVINNRVTDVSLTETLAGIE